MMPRPSIEWVAEEDLATQLNIPRSVLQAAREKIAPTDVDRDGPWVTWKKTAATAFAESLGLVWPLVQPEPVAEELTVASMPRHDGWHFPNHNIIKGRRANQELVDVRVMDSRKYTTHLRTGAPMTFRAQKSATGGHWVLVGREPRFKGAW